MEAITIIYNLKKILPELDLTSPTYQEIIHSALTMEEKTEKILFGHFKTQKLKFFTHQQTLTSEAGQIHKLFPSVKVKHIVDQLKIFQDMPQRKEIIIRLIMNSKETQNAEISLKRTNEVQYSTLNNNQPKIKVRKLDDLTTGDKWIRVGVGGGVRPSAEATVASSTNSNFFNKAPVTSTVTSTSTNSVREPFGHITHEYEVPDIMEHFDLPIINVAQNCTVTSEELPVDSEIVVKSEIILGNSEIVANSGMSASIQNNVAEDAVKKESQNSDSTDIYSLTDFPVKSESNDSTSAEVYSNDFPSVQDDHFQNEYQVNLTGPTTIKINKRDVKVKVEKLFENFGIGREVVNVPKINNEGVSINEYVENVIPRIKVEENGNQNNNNNFAAAANDRFYNMPSTSNLQNSVPMPLKKRKLDFDLIKYIRELTNAPEQVVIRQCKKFQLKTNEEPDAGMLNLLVDNIFSNVIDSEDSDVQEYHDLSDSNDRDDVMEIEQDKPREENVVPTDQAVAENVIPTDQAEKPNEEPAAENTQTVDMQLVNSLCSMFPEACPKYIRGLCKDKVMSNEVLDELITTILMQNNTYPKRPKPEPEPEVLPENQLEILQEFLPDADPDYLRMMCDKFEGKPEMVKAFINEAMEKRQYPTMKDYQRRQQLSAQQKQYTSDFCVENFMKVIPDPKTFFADPSRKIKLASQDSHYALIFMRNRYKKLPIRTIQSVFTKYTCNIRKTIEELDRFVEKNIGIMRGVRKSTPLPQNIANIPLLQELAYYTHHREIEEYIKKKKEMEDAERREAKAKGLLKTCTCCYDEELLPKDMCRCENGCEFCNSCLVKSSEVNFGDGKLDFPCLMNCGSAFTLQTLQAVLSPKLFSKIAQKKAVEEIKAAGINELEMCPFCDFATIPAEGYIIFTCMNPECMKESCRMCKEPSHIPLRCEEIEKDEEVKARTLVEDKMTEALLRKCYKCGVKFFKEEGCNKMTCSCGAQMCYVCGQPVTSYKHFNGNGGDRFDLCPLYSDTNVLNKENVQKAAEQAKTAVGISLKHDPTADLDKHYQERSKLFPQGHLLMGQLRLGAVAQPPVHWHLPPVAAHIPGRLAPQQNPLLFPQPPPLPNLDNILRNDPMFQPPPQRNRPPGPEFIRARLNNNEAPPEPHFRMRIPS